MAGPHFLTDDAHQMLDCLGNGPERNRAAAKPHPALLLSHRDYVAAEFFLIDRGLAWRDRKCNRVVLTDEGLALYAQSQPAPTLAVAA